MSKLKTYLQDPFLKGLYNEIRAAGPMRSISVDVTHKCNLRCTGCYYFAEGMDRHRSTRDDAAGEAFAPAADDLLARSGGEAELPAFADDTLSALPVRQYPRVRMNLLLLPKRQTAILQRQRQ